MKAEGSMDVSWTGLSLECGKSVLPLRLGTFGSFIHLLIAAEVVADSWVAMRKGIADRVQLDYFATSCSDLTIPRRVGDAYFQIACDVSHDNMKTRQVNKWRGT